MNHFERKESFGKKNNNDICILWIQGKDKILRCSWIENYIWQPNIPPLSHGIIILKKTFQIMANNFELTFFHPIGDNDHPYSWSIMSRDLLNSY